MAYRDLLSESGRHAAARPGPILVAVEVPATLVAQVRVARRLGAVFGVPVLLLHVAGEKGVSADLPRQLGVTAEALAGLTLVADTGDPAEGIVRQALVRDSGLMVLGMPSTIASADAGTLAVAERVLVTAPCPVLFVPERLPPDWGTRRHILVPLDGTPSTAGVMPDAAGLARRLEADLEVVYIAGAEPAPEELGTLVVPRFVDEVQHEWRQWRREFLARFAECACGGPPPVAVHLTVHTGAVVPAIRATAAAQPPDIIVLGWHGRLDEGRARVIRCLLPDSPWPVLVVRVPAVGDGGAWTADGWPEGME